MGKISAAKKKERRKDFQKVKFKVGKKLPKNQNETRATFKAKTLVIKKQFQLEKEGPVSHRNLSWRDLLAHLGHHNQSVKLDAIHSLKEMIQKNSEILKLDMNNFLENICVLFSDRDYKVREACMNLFKTFILLPDLNIKTSTKNSALEPFYSLLNVHLSCAMTHISETVQSDSLKLLDILIDHLPDLVRINAYNIFQNFIDQISKATLSKNNKKRTLKNDPYKMTSTQAWRSKVLNRLLKMLFIVASNSDSSKKLNSNKDKKKNSILINIDNEEKRECELISSIDSNENKVSSLKICKRLNSKKNLTEIKEFFEYYFKVITPLLVDCWIEAKPENKNIIETYESLSIMNSVLSILNLLLENLKFDFSDLSKIIQTAVKDVNKNKYIEHLFLGHFPYCLAENFEYNNEKTNQPISSNTINLLLCKFCSTSLLKLSADRLLEICQFSLETLGVSSGDDDDDDDDADQQHRLALNELNTVLYLSDTILKFFTNTDITKPFMIKLTKYFDAATKFSLNKWLVFEFICRQFCENNNLKELDSVFLTFFKRSIAYCILYAKNKKEKLEVLIDWIRKMIIKKQKTNSSIVILLENEYINMLNALDFESQNISESCKKKLLQLINWLPKINRFLFTKLSILILKKNLSIVNSNQILGILKERLAKDDSTFDKSDYLMFLTSLFNGSSSFDLENSNPSSEVYTLDCPKFKNHEKLCYHLEEFILSHKQSDIFIDLLISSSIPVLTSLPSVPCRTLYGSLTLLSALKSLQETPENYTILLTWIINVLFWLINEIQRVQVNQLGTSEQVNDELKCMDFILNKAYEILKKNPGFLNDSLPLYVQSLNMSNDMDDFRKMFVVINYLLVKFGSTLKPSEKSLLKIYKTYKESFRNSNYLWWHEYCNLIKTI